MRLAREARAAGPVLEYGAGTGRVTLPMARAGARVTGIDLARTMLDTHEARLEREPPQVRARVRLVHGDMRSVRLDERFALVVAPFNVMLHLYTNDDLLEFLARVREHLAPGGRFAFDVSVPKGEELSRDPERRFGAPRFRHPATGVLTRYTERFEYDPIRQLLLVWMEFLPEGGDPVVVPLTHRQLFPQELFGLLDRAGFADVQPTSDFSRAPPDASTDSLVVTCRAG